MVKVLGCWDVWHPPAEEYGVHWRFVLAHFGVDEFHMVPVTGLGEQLQRDRHDGHREINEHASLTAALMRLAPCVPVIVDENGREPLRTYRHPEHAAYLFGKTGRSLLETLRWSGESVYVEAADRQRHGLLHPHQAAAVVLHDRQVKSWQ